MSYFNNKVAIVTGGGRGIGAKTATMLAEEGAKVVVVSRTASELSTVVESFDHDKFSGEMVAVTADVSIEEDVAKLFSFTKEKFGLCDILVNNAAIIKVEDFERVTVESWDQTMAVNVRGVFLCCKQAFTHMQNSESGGSIVNLSSLGGLQGTEKFKGFTSYSVSKFAMVGLTETLAVEGKPYHIRVNCVAPGAVDTKMLQQAAPFLKTDTTPEDVAKTILFLADEKQSKCLNGTTVPIYSNA